MFNFDALPVTIDIIICTRNRPHDMERTLHSILGQSLAPTRVLIVDSGTQRADYRFFEQAFTAAQIGLRVIESEAGLTHQRNRGIEVVQSDLVCFIDDDVILEDAYLRSIQDTFVADTEGKIGGVTGRITNHHFTPGLISTFIRRTFFLPIVSAGELLPSGFVNGISQTIDNAVAVGWLSGCNMTYRREVFTLERFDETLRGYSYAEDVDFSVRVGKNFQLLYQPAARLEHCVSPINRLNDYHRAKMFVPNHRYLFKKNFPQTMRNRLAHYLSLIGVLLQKLILEKSFAGFRGALSGIASKAHPKETRHS